MNLFVLYELAGVDLAPPPEGLRERLGDLVQPDGGLYSLGHYTAWTPGHSTVTLDAAFTADELADIAAWMKASHRPPQARETL